MIDWLFLKFNFPSESRNIAHFPQQYYYFPSFPNKVFVYTNVNKISNIAAFRFLTKTLRQKYTQYQYHPNRPISLEANNTNGRINKRRTTKVKWTVFYTRNLYNKRDEISQKVCFNIGASDERYVTVYRETSIIKSRKTCRITKIQFLYTAATILIKPSSPLIVGGIYVGARCK